jgi:hypothetical protein
MTMTKDSVEYHASVTDGTSRTAHDRSAA